MADKKRAESATFGDSAKQNSEPDDTVTGEKKESAFSAPVTQSKPEPEIVDKEAPVVNNKKMSNFKGAGVWIGAVLLVLAIGAAAYSFNLYRNSQTEIKKLKTNPQEVSKVEAKELVEIVGKLIDLPAGETPTVATVTDAKKLKNQAFFAKAENGDKVLIYTESKKAILYSPSKNKIINVAPINIGPTPTPGGPIEAEQPTTAPAATTAPELTTTPPPLPDPAN